MGILNSMSEALNKNKGLAPTQPKPLTLTTQTPPQSDQQTMASNVANNLNANSLLMNSAAAKGERMAASRGLQNTTLGAEASQRAMIDAAMPIAQIDTGNQHQLNMQREQQNFTANQANLDRQHQGDMARLNSQLSHDNAMKQLGAQVSANTIGKSIDFMMQITSNFDAQIAAVQNNTQMAEKDKAIAIQNLINSRNSEVSFVTEFFNKIPTAKKDWHYFPSLGVPEVLIKPFEINNRR